MGAEAAEPALLANLLGLMLQEVTASSLQKVSFAASGQCFEEGGVRVLDRGSTRLSLNLTQTRVHAAILAARPDLNAVFYLNAPAAVAVRGASAHTLHLLRRRHFTRMQCTSQ